MFINHLTPCYCVNRWPYSATSTVAAAMWCQLCMFLSMRTPSSSSRLLKAKLFPSPARRRDILMKRCSPRGRRGSQFDMKNLLSKSPRSHNSKSHHTTSTTANGFSVKRLLELTPRTKRARSSSAVTPEPSGKHKSHPWGLVSKVQTQWQDHYLNHCLSSLPEGDVLMKVRQQLQEKCMK